MRNILQKKTMGMTSIIKTTNQIYVGDENQNIDQNLIFHNQYKKQLTHLKDSKQSSSNSLQESIKQRENNNEKQEGDYNDSVCNNISECSSSFHQKIINASSLQIEKIGSIQSAISRQISEQYCQQFKMNSDFDDSSQVTPNNQAVSSSQITMTGIMVDDECDKIVNNILQNFNSQTNINSTDNEVKKQKNENINRNNSKEREIEDFGEKGFSQKNSENLKQQSINLNFGIYKNNRNDESDVSSIDDEDENYEEELEDNYISDQEEVGNDNQVIQSESQKQLNKDESENQYRDNPLLNKGQSDKQQQNSSTTNFQIKKDTLNTNNEKQIQNQLPLYQNRKIINDHDDQYLFNNDCSTSHKYSTFEKQPSQQLIDQQSENISNIEVNNKYDESQFTSIQSNQKKNIEFSSITSSFLQESDQRQKKLDLVKRMQQLKGELNSDIEQAHNELLKLKTQKSLQFQDSCDSQNDNQERQNIGEDFSNLKQNYNKYFEISNSIQTPAFIIENNSESKQSQSNGGISTQTNASFAQMKQSELGGNFNDQNIVKKDLNDCIVQQQSQISSQINFDEGHGHNPFSDISLSQNFEQNKNNSQNQSQSIRNENLQSINQNNVSISNQKQQQNYIPMSGFNVSEIQSGQQALSSQIRSNTEGNIKNNNIYSDHIDQLQFLEQEKFKIQQLILEKQQKFQMQSELTQSEMNNSKNTINTLPPSKDVSNVSTNSIQTQQNIIPTISNQKINKPLNSQSKGQPKNIQNQQQLMQQYQYQYEPNQQYESNIQQQFAFQQNCQQQQQFIQIQQAQDQRIISQPQQEIQLQKMIIGSSISNSQKKKQKQKSAKKLSSLTMENQYSNKNDKNFQSSAQKNLLTRNLSNQRILTQSGIKTEGVLAEGVELKKQLEEKFQMQLEEIHYKNHIKTQKLVDKMKLLEEENTHIKYELQQRSLAAKELKESEARISDLAQSISDINIGKLIQQELEVKSLKEAYVKLKNTYKNQLQEKKFINCILDMVNSCNPQQIQKNPSSQQNISENSNQTTIEQEEQANLKKAWKWLKFIIEDYVNLKSKSIYQINSNKLDKNSQMYKSCVVDNQTISKSNQIEVNQSPQLSLPSDNLILQEISTLLNTENKYESLKGIKEILAQNELYRQQLTYYQKKGEPKKSSNSTSSGSKRVQTLGSASMAYNPSRDSVIQSPLSQPSYSQHQQQQQRLLSPISSQKINNSQNNKQNTNFPSPQKPKNNGLISSKNSQNNNLNQGVMMSNNNNNINYHVDMNGANQKQQQQQLMRKLSPKNNSNQVIQSENDYNSMNFTQNNNNNNQNYINGKQNSNNSNLKNSGNYTNHTSPSRSNMQGNMKQERINTLNLSPRDNNSNYNSNNVGQQINSPQSYKINKTSLGYNTNPYLQVMEKQSSKQF